MILSAKDWGHVRAVSKVIYLGNTSSIVTESLLLSIRSSQSYKILRYWGNFLDTNAKVGVYIAIYLCGIWTGCSRLFKKGYLVCPNTLNSRCCEKRPDFLWLLRPTLSGSLSERLIGMSLPEQSHHLMS